jgi:N-methylhydantoinase A
VAAPLRRSVEEAAHGVLQLAVATMTRAVKAVTTYRGRDPRDFTLCAFGGNGPLTGVEVARALGIGQVLVPPAPGVFSALGLLFSDTEHEVVRTLMLRGAEITAARLEEELAALECEATAHLDGGGAAVAVSRYADVRFSGQAYELAVPVPAGAVDVDQVAADFVAEHVRTYGHGSGDDPIDVVSLRIIGRLERTAGRRYDPVAAIRALPREEATRLAYFGPTLGLIETPVCNRAGLLDGERPGPLLVDEIDSTCVVPPGCVARLDGHGNIEVDTGA